MNELTRIARWVERLEQDLDGLQQRKAHTEGRIAKKIRALVKMANEGEVVDRDALLASLAALEAKIANAEMTHKTLEEVEQEVDRIYGDQSKNETYYFSRRNKGASQERVATTFKNLNDLADWIDRQIRDAERNAGDVERNLDQFLAMCMQLRRDELVKHAYLDTFFKRMEKRLSRLPEDDWNRNYLYNDVVDELAGMVKRIKGMRGTSFDRQSTMARQSDADFLTMPNEMLYRAMARELPRDLMFSMGRQYAELANGLRVVLTKDSLAQAEKKGKRPVYVLWSNSSLGTFLWARDMRELEQELRKHIAASGRTAGEKIAVNGLNPIGNTILEQMGGRRLSAMLGVKQYYDIRNGVGIKWPNRQRSKGNYVEIVLNGKDLYDMTFFNVSRSGKKRVAQFNDLFAESLVRVFEDHTGWYLRMSSVNASEESTDSSSGYKPRDLEDVQDDYDSTYGDQGKNDTYYDMPASEYKTELYKDLEALTTYVYGEEHESEWDGKMDQGFDSMKNASERRALESFYQELYDFYWPGWTGSQRRGDTNVAHLDNYFDDLDAYLYGSSGDITDEQRLLEDMPGAERLLKQEKQRLARMYEPIKRDVLARIGGRGSSMALPKNNKMPWPMKNAIAQLVHEKRISQRLNTLTRLSSEWWRDALEEDGLVIDPADQLDLGQPGPYDYNPPAPLDENHPLGKHDWNGHDPMDGLLGRQSKVQEAARKLMATLHSDHDLRDVAARKEVFQRLATKYKITREQAVRIAKTLEAHPVTLNTPAACGRVASALMNVL